MATTDQAGQRGAITRWPEGFAVGEAADRFRRDGVAHVRGFLTAAEVDGLEQELRRVVDAQLGSPSSPTVIVGDGPGFRALEDFGGDPWFDALGRSERFVRLASELLGEAAAPAVRDAYSEYGWQALFSLEPGSGAVTPPHQDNAYYSFVPAHTLSLWVAIDDCDAASGAMRYVVGSHQGGRRPHRLGTGAGFSLVVDDIGPADHADEVVVEPRRGDVVAHHGWTIHRADANVSDRRRWGHSLFFRAARCRRDEDAHRAYLENLARHHALTDG